MRRLLAIAIVLGGAAAHADPPPSGDDTRAAFGLPSKPAEAPLDCSDGRAFGCAQATDPLADDVPYALSTWLPASYLLSLPVADATYDQVASYALGAGFDGAGPTFLGANGLDNRWTIDGAPVDSPRTGVAELHLPLTFLDGIYVTAGGFAARDRTSIGGTIDAELRGGTPHHELDVRAWAGFSGTPRQAPLATDAYQVRRGTAAAGPSATVSLVATGPLPDVLGGRAWYAAGVAPSVQDTDFTWHAANLVDADGDGVADGLPGLAELQPIDTTNKSRLTWNVPVMARAGFDRGAHHVEVTLVGSGATSAFYLANSTLQAAGVDRTTFVGDAIATWHGTWHDTRARVQLAWHRSERHEAASDPAAADQPQLLSAYVPSMLADDPLLAAACTDPDPSKFTKCPVPAGWFASGGAGELVDVTADRPSITADIAHRFGSNVVRAGATGEDVRLVTASHFTGGSQIRSLFPGEAAVRRFLDPNIACSQDVTVPCATVDTQTLRYRTRYTAAYAEDTWHATPDLQVDGGLRWELMWVGTVLHFSDELAPRLGIAWDPLGGGRSRVWASMGRSYGLLAAGLGPTVIGGERYVEDVTSPFGTGRAVVTGQPFAVAPGIMPIAQDEVTTGAQVAVARRVRATVWLAGRSLVRGLDTVPDGFDNPGRDGAGTLPASRDTIEVAAELATAPTDTLVLRVGYMYGQTIGSWTGAFNPRQGAVLYAGDDFDFTSANLLGPLPTDLGNRAYIEAERKGHVGPVELGFATRLTVQSGLPRDVLGNDGGATVYLLPRGSGGRLPMQSLANVRLSATWHGVDATLDIFDLFDRRDATAVDEYYASGALRPIDGGTMSDLVFLRTSVGTVATRNTAYGLPTAFAGPFGVVLGAHAQF